MRRTVAALHVAVLTLASFSAPGTNAFAASAQTIPGLQVAFSTIETGNQGGKDVFALPNLSLHVPANTSPTPFLPVGRFTAVWSGFLSLDLRSDYRFQAELNGELKLELNDVTVLEAAGSGGAVAPSQSVRLNKGTNRIRATFHSPPSGDAFIRLSWIPKGGLPAPIPLSSPSHRVNEDLAQADKRRIGRALFLEYRCAKCHDPGPGFARNPESKLDAPSFEGIGSRRNRHWMTEWILDPKARRSTSQMPRIFHGGQARENAEASAAFLASLKSDESGVNGALPSGEEQEEGKQLFENLHCAACHNPPDASETDSQRVSLKQVRQKYPPGNLSSFLQRPEAHYAWIRMPNFKLSSGEANQLAAYLNTHAGPAKDQPSAVDPQSIERGKKLIQVAGCLNCHSMKLENQFSAKPLSGFSAGAWNRGCLAADAAQGGHSPYFGFSGNEREALRSFAATDQLSLTRFVSTEFAHRQIGNLKCQECHGKFDGFPSMEILGGKLNPDWVTAFIAGRIHYKPRPWIPARMPSFSAVAEGIGQGWTMLHGYPPHASPEQPIDPDAAKIGQKLVSADGGFSCIACHAVGKAGVTLVFDSPGINLAYVAERLQRPYFTRWLYSPLSVDPGTKMPVYFDELGKSSLSEIYEGDGAKQIDAIWQYLRLGDRMPTPAGAELAP